MEKAIAAKIITANDLLSGEVVYLTDTGAWSRSPDDAVLLPDGPAADERLAMLQRQDTSAIGPYLAAATRSDNGKITPAHFRELFRTTGPSNRFIGKQAA